MSVLFTDTDCEMSYTDAESLNLRVIGMPYTIMGKEQVYDYGKNTDIKEFYRLMKEGEIPTTAALNSEDYLGYFEPVLKAGEDILYVHFSGELSGTFNYMQTAINILKEKYPERKITCFDTKNISLGAGILVIAAAKLHNSGASDEEVLQMLSELKNRVSIYFYVDSLKYLKRGGRISSATAVMGSMLNIKPILTVTPEGRLEKMTTVMGSKKALHFLYDRFTDEYLENTDYEVFVIDADNFEGGRELIEKIEASGKKVKARQLSVGPVIGTHCGPGTIGLVFINKNQ